MSRPRKHINRERIYEAMQVHPGIQQHTRMEMMIRQALDALCDELEGK